MTENERTNDMDNLRPAFGKCAAVDGDTAMVCEPH